MMLVMTILVLSLLAAYNVGETTVHRLFQSPIEHEGKTTGYCSKGYAH